MNVHKFFYLTIQGDNLDLELAQSVINLPCKTFRKGEIVFTNCNGKSYEHSPQRTNRWLYSTEDISGVSSEDFLLKQLEILIEHLSELKNYIVHGMVTLELTLYAENATDFQFSTDHIAKLSQLGLGISISFC